MQTLQIYRKPDKIPSDARFKKIEEELRQVRVKFPMPVAYRHPEKVNEERKSEIVEGPKIKSIELQNKLRRIENQLNFWVSEYRDIIDELRELERILPKNHHNLRESEDQARENVQKIIKVEEVRDRVLDEYRNLSIRFEEMDGKTKKQIRKLETELIQSQTIIEDLEFDLKKLKKRVE